MANITGMIIYFDASNSGTQVLGLSSNCHSSMIVSNVIPSFDLDKKALIRDTYLEITEEMYDYVDLTKTVLKTDKKKRRKQVKKTVMTVLYGSTKQPKNVFGEGTEDYKAFYNSMHSILPGPMALMELMQSLWDPTKTYLSWEIDGVHAHIAILDQWEGHAKMTISGRELSIPFRSVVHQAVDKGLSIAANVTHFIDALIKDRVVMDFKRAKKPITVIHDDFGCMPNDVPMLMESYRQALLYVYQNKILESILRQLSGDPTLTVPQIGKRDYSDRILQSRYALS